MAILYSYPETLELLPEDMLIGTSTIRVAGKKKNITKNFTLELLKNFILDGVTNVQWGTITGTLSNQTDLQAALNAKQNNITLTTTGSTGPATFASNVLNIPDYSTGMAVPTLNQVLTAGNTSLLDAEVNTIGVYDATELAYGYLSINNSDFTLSDSLGVNSIISRMGITFSGQIGGSSGTILLSALTASRIYTLPNATGTVALTSDIGTWGALNYPTWTAGAPFVKMTAVGTFALDTNTYLTSAVTSVGMTVPSAFSVTPSTITSSGTFAITGAGVASQYVRGDGTLANFPTSTGGGASVSYYLNGSISQGTIGGVAYKEMNSVPVIGAGTDFTINADGYIAQFITDVGDPNKLLIPAGNWNFETYFSASSGGGSPRFYIELYKYDGATFTLIATNSATPENITGGTSIDLYFTALAVPATTLLATDRLAVRFYVIHSGRTITMHTENSHLSQIITTFSTGLTALNGLTSQVQYFAVGTSGTDFNISSATDTHTFNLPTASATNRGALSSTDWSAFNGKFTLPSLTSGSVLFSNGTTIAQDNANFFWDDTNNRLGIGTITPTHPLNVYTTIADVGILLDSNTNPAFIIKRAGVERLKLTATGAVGTVNGLGNGLAFHTDSVERMRINTAGNVGIGTASPTAKLHIAAPGALSSDIALRVRNSADTADLMVVNGTGTIITSSGAIFYTLGNNFNLRSNLAGGSGFVLDAQSYNSLNSTNNEQGFGFFSGTFAPTSGTGTLNGLKITPTINQTGGANGITRGLFINPTLTAAADFRAIETTVGNVILGSTSGNVGIGMTPTAKLAIKAPGALSTDIALRVRNSADTGNLMTVAGNGAVRLGIYEPTSDTTAAFVAAASSHYFYVKSNTNLSGEVGIRRGNGSQEDGIYRFVFDNSQAFINYDRPNQILSLNCQFHTAFNTNGVERGRFNNNGNFLINTTTDIASSKLTIASTTQGFLPPRMTNAQRIAIATPAVGLCVYCTDAVEGLYINKSTGWTYIG